MVQKNIAIVIAVLSVAKLHAFTVSHISIEKNHYNKKWPCGCIALYHAGLNEGKAQAKAVTKAITQAIRAKKDLTSSVVLEEIAVNAKINCRFLMLSQNQKPIITGTIIYYPNLQTPEQARDEKTENLLSSFRISSDRYMHFICHMKAQTHGFLISLNKRTGKPLMRVYQDYFTKKDPNLIKTYIYWIGQYYYAQPKDSQYKYHLNAKVALTRSELFNHLAQMRLSYLGPITIEKY